MAHSRPAGPGPPPFAPPGWLRQSIPARPGPPPGCRAGPVVSRRKGERPPRPAQPPGRRPPGRVGTGGPQPGQTVERPQMLRLQLQDFLVMRHRRRKIPPPLQEHAQLVMGIGVIRPELRGALVMLQGRRDPALPRQGHTQMVVGVGGIRQDLNSSLQNRDRFRNAVLLEQHRAPVVVASAEAGFKLHGLAVMFGGFGPGTPQRQQAAQVVLRLEIARLTATPPEIPPRPRPAARSTPAGCRDCSGPCH